MTARELFEYLNERGEADTPLMVFMGYDEYDYLEELDISIYDDCVQLG